MKLEALPAAIKLLLCMGIQVRAQTSEELLLTLPPCSISCISEGLNTTACSLLDISCLCASDNLWTRATQCAIAKCSTPDALKAQKISKDACGVPIRNRSSRLYTTSATLLAITTVFIVTRILARSPRRFELFGPDDMIILGAYVTSVPMLVIDVFLARYGCGQDVWTLAQGDITQVLFNFFLAEPFYLVSTVLMKVSILAFYLRIFVDTKVRYITFGVMASLACFTISFLFSLILQCHPVSYAWTRWQKEVLGKCININAGIWSHAALNIFFDLLVLAIPIPTLLGLQFSYSLRSKLQIIGMFSIGILVTIVSILRLQSLVKVANTVNPTWDYYEAALWSAIEVYTGIICACLPSARVFAMRVLPSWLGLTARGSSAEPMQRLALRKAALSRHPLSWSAKTATAAVSPGLDGKDADFVKLDDVGSVGSAQNPNPAATAHKPIRFSGTTLP